MERVIDRGAAWYAATMMVAGVLLLGGLLALICYIGIFVRGFSEVGTARKLVNGRPGQEWLFWCLGSALFATVVAHFGINYMAQLIMGFFPLVACIAVATSSAKQTLSQSPAAPALEQLTSSLSAPMASLPVSEKKRETRLDTSSRRNCRRVSWQS